MRRIWSVFIVGCLVISLCSGFLRLASDAIASTNDLFISEYIEGSSNDKALEIYNGTGALVDLTAGDYSIQVFFNGAAKAELTIPLTGTVPSGDVHVVAQSSAAAAILAQADETNGWGWFNGDDAVALRRGTTIIDVIGQIGVDPGDQWGLGMTSTKDNVLVRKSSIMQGDPDGSDAFDPAAQWDGYAADDFSHLGAHTLSGDRSVVPDSTPPTVTVAVPADGAVVTAALLTVQGQATDNVAVTSILVGSVTVSAQPDGSFTASVTLTEGQNSIDVVAYDAAGNNAATKVTVTYKKPLVITASAGTGGAVSPSGATSVEPGSSQSFSIAPDSGYSIADVTVDGVSQGAVSSYTFRDVTSSHTIRAVFEQEKKQTIMVLQIGKSAFTVAGSPMTLDSPPVIKNGRTLVPIRAIIEALGGSVGWDGTVRKATVSLGNTSLELWIGKGTAAVNGMPTPIDPASAKVVPEIINGRTMLPLRFVSENLGCSVMWADATKTITITYQP